MIQQFLNDNRFAHSFPYIYEHSLVDFRFYIMLVKYSLNFILTLQ
jgi:hypothetical protein